MLGKEKKKHKFCSQGAHPRRNIISTENHISIGQSYDRERPKYFGTKRGHRACSRGEVEKGDSEESSR